MYARIIKRILDSTISLIMIVILSPLFFIIAGLVGLTMGRPVIFKQLRPGIDEEFFYMYKFRTMTNERCKMGILLPDNERLTRFGRFLRASSLDEIPEFINVIKGDMSLVGPRPQLIKDLVFMNETQRKRHFVKPGITGWAQINGRNAISWEQKLDLDIDYLRKISFSKDVQILFLTIKKVVSGENVSTEGLETAEDFGDYLLRTGKISEEYYAERVEEGRRIERSFRESKD
jgi:lipopolysaccharide/colanic/teichoic acid biosynthesis glycosyltransferase